MSTLPLCVLNLVGMMQTTDLVQSFSSFKCNFFLMTEEILIILCHRVKDQGQVNFQASHVSC